MAEIDKTTDTDFDLTWARGDNDPKVFVIKDAAGVVVNISAQTFRMAVNSKQNPSDTLTEIFDVLGVFVTDGSDGKVGFTPPANSLDAVAAPSNAFYDISRATPSKKTLIKARVCFVMDIGKG